jgi:ABC-type sugar transport system permease subunit
MNGLFSRVTLPLLWAYTLLFVLWIILSLQVFGQVLVMTPVAEDRPTYELNI